MTVSHETARVDFGIVPGRIVNEVLTAHLGDIVDLVRDTYLAHEDARASNPHSHFLTFPDRPRDRIIALAADIRDERPVAGLKWISSWPENVEQGLPRASAVIVLNRRDTGYPYALLEGSLISAIRTAGSAVLAAEYLFDRRQAGRPPRIGFVGCGLIARYVFNMFRARRWSFDRVVTFDLVPECARAFANMADSLAPSSTACTLETLIEQSDIVVFATTASTPHVHEPRLFAHSPLVLHISLRDLSADIILSANNVVDDVDHCLRANTSPHLAEQKIGHREFVSGTIGGIIRGNVALKPQRPIIFSPFGMGILDMAVARLAYDLAADKNAIHGIPDFFYFE